MAWRYRAFTHFMSPHGKVERASSLTESQRIGLDVGSWFV